jgi:hypothetical protein
MDKLKTFINEKIRECNKEIGKTTELLMRSSYPEYEQSEIDQMIGEIRGYDNVLEFLEQDEIDSKEGN